jgi:hypothetical protein
MMSGAEFDHLRGEFRSAINDQHIDLPGGIGETVCDMALLMILKTLGLKSSNVLDLMCCMVPEMMKRYGIEKLPQSNLASAPQKPEGFTQS